MKRMHIGISLVIVSGLVVLSPPIAAGQDKPLPHGVEKICAISFDKDSKRPARVEEAALDCLNRVSRRLKASPNQKVVLVGTADPIKDHAEEKRGQERMKEDGSGEDVRFGDVANVSGCECEGLPYPVESRISRQAYSNFGRVV